MLDLWKEGIVAHIQVHDELDISVTNIEETRTITEIMENCVKLKLPIKVDSELGSNWGNATQTPQQFWS